jgi:carbamoyl-phosphate synthase small subunit
MAVGLWRIPLLPPLIPSLSPAVLALADGTIFPGYSIGAAGQSAGEVVFNTALTGYQEILTDPSYTNQLVTLTYPHIGNVGVNDQDRESGKIYAAGLIIKDLSLIASNFRSEKTLSDYLSGEGIVGIAGIDTRKLTRILRDKGAQPGAIVAGKLGDSLPAITEKALAAAKGFPGMAGLDLAKVVTTKTAYDWTEGEWGLNADQGKPGFNQLKNPLKHVVAYDFGVKRNILRMLSERGCKITVVPAQTSAADVMALKPDGVFFSNGPGDPEPCDYAIAAAKSFIDQGMPTFGICLGHQIMGLAAGAKTLKMKFGHHGANHPVKDLDSGRVVITSQNHGFAVDAATLPANVRPTHVSLFDGSLQGLAWTDKPAFCFQGHPEASPGPHDIAYLFDRFIKLM